MTTPKGYRYRYIGKGIGRIKPGDELVYRDDDSVIVYPPKSLPFILDQATVNRLGDSDVEAMGPEPDVPIQ
jgi:hypothetical protein